MNFSLQVLLFGCYALLWALPANAQTAQLRPLGRQDVRDFSSDLLILRDSARKIPTDQVVTGKLDLLFVDNYTLLKGIEKQTGVYWAKLILHNKEDIQQSVLLKMPTYLPEIHVFVKEGKQSIDTLYTGNRVPRSVRSSRFAGHIPGTLDLLLPPKVTYTLYIRFSLDWQHYQPKKLTLQAYNLHAQNEVYANRKLLFGIVFGIVIVMILYNLALYLAVRDVGYLYYVLYISVTGLFSMNYTNYTFQYFWPELPEWHRLSFVHLGTFSIATFLLFSKKFIRLRRYLPKLNQAINYAMLLLLAPLIFLWSGDIYTADLLMAIFALLTFLVILYFTILIVRRQNRSAYFLLAGFSALIICFILFLLYFYGPLKGDFEVYSYLPQIGVVAQIVIFGIGLSDRVYQLQLENKELLEARQEKLEKEVARRTAEVTQQKEEILAQRDAIDKKNTNLELTLQQLHVSQEKIKSSLNYAQRIQAAFLPHTDKIAETVPDFFIFFRPKDIVSGDFYWFQALPANRYLFAVADCTGHGVPGAFMSVIGESSLNKIVTGLGITTPGEILNVLHREVMEVLHQGATNNRDGMDITLCLVDRGRNELQVAGARNQLTLIQSGEKTVVKGDKQSIGGYTAEGYSFTNHTLPLAEEAYCYLASDGYRDQIGGPEGRKIYQKYLDELLMEIHRQPMAEQKKRLAEELDQWMGKQHKQLDDILVVGFRA